jgi:hypothetical protein
MTWIKTGRLYIRADEVREMYFRPTEDRNEGRGYEFFAMTGRKKPRLGFFKLNSEKQAERVMELVLNKLSYGGIIDFDTIVEEARRLEQ